MKDIFDACMFVLGCYVAGFWSWQIAIHAYRRFLRWNDLRRWMKVNAELSRRSGPPPQHINCRCVVKPNKSERI